MPCWRRTRDAVLGESFGSSVDGSARGSAAIPGADHITILFSTDALQQSVDWLDSSVGAPSSGHTVGGGTIGWLLVLTVGAAIGFIPLARLAFPGRPVGRGGLRAAGGRLRR